MTGGGLCLRPMRSNVMPLSRNQKLNLPSINFAIGFSGGLGGILTHHVVVAAEKVDLPMLEVGHSEV
jgi:hypothetical protein